jgi:large subunit ribosomal protein L3
MKFILGKKLKMSQIFDEKGNQIPITLIEAGPCFVTQIKTKDKDGYIAAQIGFEKIEKARTSTPPSPSRPKGGSLIKKTIKGKEFRYIKEQRIENKEQLKVGDKIDVLIFKEGDKVSISGISKGKGFAGAVKRFKVAGFPKTHGTKHGLRSIGSIGSRFPQRVIKGKKMAGRMGGERVTVKNLKIVKIDKENNILAIKGAIPGRKGTLLEVRSMK